MKEKQDGEGRLDKVELRKPFWKKPHQVNMAAGMKYCGICGAELL